MTNTKICEDCGHLEEEHYGERKSCTHQSWNKIMYVMIKCNCKNFIAGEKIT